MESLEKAIAAVVMTAIVVIGGCTGAVEMAGISAKRAMVDKGASPIDVRCAFVASGSMDPICVAHSAKR
jgi:hypothetical protein